PESPEDLTGAVEGGCVQIAPLDGSWVASRASGGLEHRCEEDAGTHGRVDDTDARVAEPCPHAEPLTQGAGGLAHDERRQRGRRVDDARRTSPRGLVGARRVPLDRRCGGLREEILRGCGARTPHAGSTARPGATRKRAGVMPWGARAWSSRARA